MTPAAAEAVPLAEVVAAAAGLPVAPAAPKPAASKYEVMRPWLRAQAINVTRHAAALRPFRRDEFGTGAEAPSDGHIQVVNDLIGRLRHGLHRKSRRATRAAAVAAGAPTAINLRRLVIEKDSAHCWVQGIEKIWDFYLELFGQRQSQYGGWLLACDRIALDCYQGTYTGLGAARTVPAPPPFCYMRTGFAPATFRRGVKLSRIKQLNPFPLVQLPYHRLINPWTLGAVLHEVSHNLQSDLDLSKPVPKNVALALLKSGASKFVAQTWAKWNREMFADMAAVLLGGPVVVGSLMDVVGRKPSAVLNFNPGVPHPTPYLRTLISVEMLRRLGFIKEAKAYANAWTRIYPNPREGTIPKSILDSFPQACAIAVDAMCFKPYQSLGNKSLAQVIPFASKDQVMIEEAAGRMAAGTDPGIIPERYLIAASRVALDRRLASASVIATNFYKELTRK